MGGRGAWLTGRGLGRGPAPGMRARDLELGTLEPSGSNPPLGIEPSAIERPSGRELARARGGGHGTRRMSSGLS